MPIDIARRQKVMARSQKLGHCVCNAKKSCPCDTLIDANVCPCAGERPPVHADGPVALTRTVAKAGCASKIGQGDLKRILNALPEITSPNILVGMAAGDDAGVWRLDDHTALVQTVDVFTPCVDDAYLFGQIAAANSVSDVYAMGGRPITALSIACFPIDDLPGGVMQEMLRGGIDKLNEAGCALIGGHSVNDPEPKLGFAVTGLIAPDRVVERGAARPGDVLVLTKPLGTGMVAFAVQLGRIAPAALDDAGRYMATLNRDAAERMTQFGAHAATDVTGFGLAGHLVELARTSGVSVALDFRALPVYAAVPYCLENEILSGAIERNQEYAMAWVRNDDPDHERNLPLLYDPQTSGGMLVSLPPAQAEAFVAAMRARGHAATAIIGRVLEKSPGAESEVRIEHARLENFIGSFEITEPPTPELTEPSFMDHPTPQQHTNTDGQTPMLSNADSQTSKVDGQTPKGSNFSVAPGGAERNPGSVSNTPRDPEGVQPYAPQSIPQSCCDNPPNLDAVAPASTVPGDAGDALAIFKDFMKAANAPGLIDKRNKKLMAIMLSIAVRCTPCLRIHLKGALAMGLSKAEIDEAASLAIAFGGCSALMFYKEICEELKI